MTSSEPHRRRSLTGTARRLRVDTSPLRRSRDFRLLWGGELVSQIGSQVTLVALFVQVYALTHSSAAVGLIGLVQIAPMIVASIGFGPQIDRRDRRRILIGAQLGLMASSVMLFAGALAGHPPLALLYVAAAMSAGFATVAMPTRAAMTPRLVSVELLAPSAALNQVMWNGAALVGPALGGIIVASFGLRWAYGIDVGSYVFAVAAAWSLRPQPPLRDTDGDERGWTAALAGLRYVKGRRVLQSTFTIDVVAMVFGMPRALFPVLAATRFHRGALVVGLLFAAPAAGALLAALSSGWVAAVQRQGLAILLAVIVWGAGITAFGVCGNRLWLALPFLAIAGGADIVSAVFRSTLQQLVVPDDLRGRLAAFNIFVVAGGPRLGDLESGLVASAVTPTFAVVSGGVLCLAGVAVIALAVPRFARWRIGDPP